MQINKVIDAFMGGTDADELTEIVAEWMTEVRQQIELNGRVQEINRMLEYHRELVQETDSPSLRQGHLESISVLEARLRKVTNGHEMPRVRR